MTLDIDDTVDVVHIHQQLWFFNAHYDERCFLPIHVDDTAVVRPVAILLRPGKTPSGKEVCGHRRRLVRRIHRHWPATHIIIRTVSHGAAIAPSNPSRNLQHLPQTPDSAGTRRSARLRFQRIRWASLASAWGHTSHADLSRNIVVAPGHLPIDVIGEPAVSRCLHQQQVPGRHVSRQPKDRKYFARSATPELDPKNETGG